MRCFWVLFLAGFIWSLPVGAENSSDLAQGLELYNKRKFPQAYKIFADAGSKKPGDGSAFLYAANCLYQMGNNSSASRMYEYVQKHFPASRNAPIAAAMLKRIGSGANATAGTASSATTTTAPDDQTIRKAAVSGPSDCSDLMEIVRPLFGHPPVTEATINTVRRAVQGLPSNVKETLRSNGAKIYLCTTLIDKEPSLKNREGRGYDGYTYKSCPGMFWNNRIYLCERTLDESDDSVKEAILLDAIVGTLYHEVGHALDWYSGNISGTEDFKHAYLLDSARVDVDGRSELAYYLQKSDAGQQECCGELIGILLGKQDTKTNKMRAAFPGTLKLLKAKLEI